VYARSVRDTVGGGEGVFGIVDGYPDAVPAASPARLERIEELCLSWRFRIKRKSERLARIHGDFHPFNVLFDDGTGLSVLDTSRGSVGDPADDVCAMAINFGFFALGHPNAWRDALRSLWYGFWERYGALTRDAGLYEVVAPFLAWRGLVLSNPKWYPALASADRDRILAFVEKALASARFDSKMAEEFFDS
jgi:aminoglycoside phosphotransferase (APT) family kinase protein